MIAAIALAALTPVVALLAIDIAVSLSARGRIYSDPETVPETPVALVLGTSYRRHGQPNPFFDARMDAAAELFQRGRVRALLVSGDNATRYYNEPWTMRSDLITRGIPDAYITLDYAGFRTLDSIVRAKAVFGQAELVIVTQRFHAARALLIARHVGLHAVAYAAADPPASWYLPVRLREIIARAVAVLDLVSGRGPHFLGDPEPVPLKPLPLPATRDEEPCPPPVSARPPSS